MSYAEKAGMMLRYSLFSTAVCLVLIFIYGVLYKKGRRIHVEDVILMILLVCISSLRYGMGSDYFRYLESSGVWSRSFKDLSRLFTWATIRRFSFEIGFKFLSVLSSRVSSSPYAVFWTVSIVLYVPIVWYCRKHTSNASAAIATFLLFGFWGMSLNVLQQSLAMVCVLWAYEALKNRKYLAFGALVVCAESFHTTAIVAVLVVLVVHFGLFKRLWRPTMRNLVILICIGVALRLGTDFFLRIASRISFFSKYIGYLNADVTSGISRKYLMFGVFFETMLVIGILYFAIRNLDRLKLKNPSIENVISIIMLGLPLSIVGISRTLWLANRFTKFNFLFLVILIPELAGEIRNKDPDPSRFVLSQNQLLFWGIMIAWHAVYAVLMLDNNRFQIGTYLFQ